MKIRRYFALIIALFLLLSIPGYASAAEPEDSVAQMINYYHYHQDRAAGDIGCLIEQLGKTDAALAEKWQRIFEYWDYVNSEMPILYDVLPDGLPGDDSLCIVVLGYALLPDGTMQDELIGRLETALASAEKYPNAFIACTGGGTASREPDATEADCMAQWLMDQGISQDRIIVENQSRNTSQNAQFTFDILSAQYPGIRHLAIVTSDYHLPRGCLLYHTQAQLSSDDPLDIIACAGFDPGHDGSESISLQSSAVAQLAGVSISDMEEPELSRLTGITLGGVTEYDWNASHALTVTAHYDSGLSRDVTAEATISGFNSTLSGTQTVSAVFSENDLEFSSELEIAILPEPTDAPTAPPAEETPATDASVPQKYEGAERPFLIPAVIWACLLAALIVLLIVKKLRRR